MNEITFTSGGATCAAWHLPATTDAYAGEHGRPCVVIAHGFGGTRDTGLLDYAEGFAQAGIDAFVFDYRGFGASDGTPRQLVSYRRQRQDYHAAIAAARNLSGVDPDRIVLWGTSYSGGHVIAVAATDKRVAAVISMTPAMPQADEAVEQTCDWCAFPRERDSAETRSAWFLARGRLGPVVVELEEVVGGCDQAPFRPRGGTASSSQPGDPAVVFDLSEHRLDAASSFFVELAADLDREHAAHERVHAAFPAGAGAVADHRVGRHQHAEAIGEQVLHLVCVPVARVREHAGLYLAS
jgi:dienelactone hydrolase